MHLTSAVAEFRIIDSLTHGLPRSPRQLNGVHESDAELVAVETPGEFLAVTTDSISEELAAGLYDDPRLAGWMVVMASLSDLAAVGAEPVGVVVSVVLPPGTDDAYRAALAQGMGDACRRAGTFVLGGDTNEGRDLVLTGTAIGHVPRHQARTRLGATAGDLVYLTGPAGLGAAFALARLRGGAAGSVVRFQPVARLSEGLVMREHARCCIDTSDGVLHALDTLARLNGCGFFLGGAPEMVHPQARAACQQLGIPAWLSLACVHGEFELCFTIAPRDEEPMLRRARDRGFEFIRIGQVVSASTLAIREDGATTLIDTDRMREAARAATTDAGAYLRALIALARAGGTAP